VWVCGCVCEVEEGDCTWPGSAISGSMARRREAREKERLIEVGVRALVSGRAARTCRGSIYVVMEVSLVVSVRRRRKVILETN
jgi:hypothetical protein